MPHRFALACALLAAGAAHAATSSPVRGAAAAAQFERLKSLAGDWDADIDADGTPDALVTYRLTAAGSVLVETLFAGTDHEMVTMYHENGNELWLTHYCAAGNQPRMRLVATNPLTFDFVDATNMASRNATHMGRGEITFLDADHVRAEWTSFESRKPSFIAKFDLRRRPATASGP